MVDPQRMNLMKADMRQQLLEVLKSPAAPRQTLCVDTSLFHPLQIILESQDLSMYLRGEKPGKKPKTIERIGDPIANEIYEFTPEVFHTENRRIVYLLRSRPDQMRHLHHHLKTFSGKRELGGLEIVVCLVPRMTLLCAWLLREYGILVDSADDAKDPRAFRKAEDLRSLARLKISVRELDSFDLFPIDKDVLSLELDFPFRELSVDGDTSAVSHIAKALKKLQEFFGQIPPRSIRGKGRYAERVCRMLLSMRYDSDAAVSHTPEIDSLYVIDRDVDLLTPMKTQVTYEGLIDELFGIQRGCFSTDEETRRLREDDRVFQLVRDRNVVSRDCGKRLRVRADDMKIREAAAMSRDLQVSEMAAVIRELPNFHQEKEDLGVHIGLCKKLTALTAEEEGEMWPVLSTERRILEGRDEAQVIQTIQDMMFTQQRAATVLRLICMLSLVGGGLKPRVYDQFKTLLTQNYGLYVLVTLENLEKAGLLRRQESRPALAQFASLAGGASQLAVLQKYMSLLPRLDADGRPVDEADAYETCGGYAPICCRLIEAATRGRTRGWKTVEQSGLLQALPGPTFPPDDQADHRTAQESGTQRVVMVFFIGGCTRSEVSAFRALTNRTVKGSDDQEGLHTTYLIGTTKLVTGDSLIESLFPVLR
eukprot:TRINITY_DN10832_c0_g1_i1.p1 TRINITY_DN10832_c0_g1~~TRINITY_DN10832_c0_g1_i1.p1  ORF type:complete len:650 (+),score=210.47 TRINITY_DN10832_c0_g1_i1:82-2031(+)